MRLAPDQLIYRRLLHADMAPQTNFHLHFDVDANKTRK